MKKFLLKVTSGPDHSFAWSNERCRYFYDELHFHPEIELTLIEAGEGTRFVGDSIERFGKGEIVLLGSNLPHLWKSDSKYYLKSSKRFSASVVVHFLPDFLGRDFFKTPEVSLIGALLQKAERGIALQGSLRARVKKKMKSMGQLSRSKRLLLLLDILDDISQSDELRLLCAASINPVGGINDVKRIKNIQQYVLSNFKKKISLHDVASVASMTPTAFSRYFRQRTRKTFSTFLKEVRVAHACNLLTEQNLKISEVCYESGFKNLSNFNVQFKSVVKKTPQQYYQTMKKFG
jgi:AraC-like DNA-binding protein